MEFDLHGSCSRRCAFCPRVDENKYPNIFVIPRILPGADTNFLAFPLQLKNDCDFKRNELQIYLEKNNIQTRVIFTGNILRQPGFKNIKYISSGEVFVNADKVMKNGLLIGCHQGLNLSDIKFIHKKIEKFLNKKL